MANPEGGFIRRTWRRLTTPSARWSVLALLVIGIILGFVATAGTQIMVHVTGTNEFCGGACHSMTWVAEEYQKSGHGANRTGVKAGCHDCHLPNGYPMLLWDKAKAGTKDVINEIRGIISTKEKFEKERARMANHVWEEYAANNSKACRNCHQFTAAVIEKQKEEVRPIHTAVMQGNGTCIDCHKGIAHKSPE